MNGQPSTVSVHQLPILLRGLALLVCLFPLVACASSPPEPGQSLPASRPVALVAKYPHDRDAFTQGLLYVDERLFESTGRYGQSTLREVALDTGEVLHKLPLQVDEFGEDITAIDGRLFQLTWQNHIAFVYTLDSLERTGSFRYRGEGWGLTHDGSRLIMSDGSAVLRFYDPEDFVEIGTLAVHADGEPLHDLNALQYYEGRILANVWQTRWIAEIDPTDGRVLALHDLTPLFEHLDFTPRLAVESPNGIAYDAAGGRLFVTGKYWPWLFEVELDDGDE